MRLETAAQAKVVASVIDAGHSFGHSLLLAGRKVNLEFVITNPTGPIHRSGTAVGDALGHCSPQGADVVANTISSHGARSTDSPTPERRSKGEPTPKTATRAATSPTSPSRCCRRARSARRRLRETFPLTIGVGRCSTSNSLCTRVRCRLRRLHPTDSMHRQPGRERHRPTPRNRQHLRRTAQPGCAPAHW